MTDIKGKTIFITGGTGFIGSRIAERLIQDNRIVIYNNQIRNALQYSPIKDHKNLQCIQGNVVDQVKLVAAIEETQPEYIIHCAAVAGVDAVIKDPVNTLEVNIDGSHNVLKGALKVKNLKRVIMFSTSEIFGSESMMSTEVMPAVIGAVGEARWTYALSKLATEHYAHAYFLKHKIPTVILRPFNIYGPGQVGEGALSIFIQKALRNDTIEVHGDGHQIRAWCYVDDIVEASLTVLSHPKAVGESFNIGNNRSTVSIQTLAETVVQLLRSSSRIVHIPRPYVDIELRSPNTTKAEEMLGFVAKMELEEGILLTTEYYKRFL